MADESSALWSKFSSTIVSSAVLLFQENECQNTNALMANVDTIIKFEKRSLIHCAHNKLYRNSAILFNGLETSLSINEGSIMIVKNNIMEYSSVALYNMNSSFILSSGKIIFEENEGHNYSHVLQTRHSSSYQIRKRINI